MRTIFPQLPLETKQHVDGCIEIFQIFLNERTKAWKCMATFSLYLISSHYIFFTERCIYIFTLLFLLYSTQTSLLTENCAVMAVCFLANLPRSRNLACTYLNILKEAQCLIIDLPPRLQRALCFCNSRGPHFFPCTASRF